MSETNQVAAGLLISENMAEGLIKKVEMLCYLGYVVS